MPRGFGFSGFPTLPSAGPFTSSALLPFRVFISSSIYVRIQGPKPSLPSLPVPWLYFLANLHPPCSPAALGPRPPHGRVSSEPPLLLSTRSPFYSPTRPTSSRLSVALPCPRSSPRKELIGRRSPVSRHLSLSKEPRPKASLSAYAQIPSALCRVERELS